MFNFMDNFAFKYVHSLKYFSFKGMAKIDRASKEFSFMVKLTPEIGFRAAMVKEVSTKSSVINVFCSIDDSYF